MKGKWTRTAKKAQVKILKDGLDSLGSKRKSLSGISTNFGSGDNDKKIKLEEDKTQVGEDVKKSSFILATNLGSVEALKQPCQAQ